MMQFISVVTIFGIALICVLAEKETYSDRYDDVDIMNILNNEKLLAQYYDCYMDTGPCVTADARFFKGIFGEAVVTKCEKCTEKQKELLDIIISWYTKNKPDEWQALLQKSLKDMEKKNADQ